MDLTLGSADRCCWDPDLLEFLDDTMDYGEDRFLALGLVAGVVYAVVYAERQDATRIISVRTADKREHARYFSR
ncbi:BrnT family toxin [Nitrospirillum sp. BR 11752]|uniref:BrnT family toxin n=1 Tax=Nitrospirillum sp. BR 11752 TaxID=3104293 RepID=UPI002EA9CD43|nr:BrnT family toxin [Nitrospirillum sp. BR 11752]